MHKMKIYPWIYHTKSPSYWEAELCLQGLLISCSIRNTTGHQGGYWYRNSSNLCCWFKRVPWKVNIRRLLMWVFLLKVFVVWKAKVNVDVKHFAAATARGSLWKPAEGNRLSDLGWALCACHRTRPLLRWSAAMQSRDLRHWGTSGQQ